MIEATWCVRCDETGTGPCRCDRIEAQAQEDGRELVRLRAELADATRALQTAFETTTQNLGELAAEIIERTGDTPCTRCVTGCRDHRCSRGERVCIICIERERDELELRRAALQDLACKVLAVLEDEPHEDAVPIVVELLNEHLEAGDLTLDWARLGEVAAVAGAQDEQADLIEALAEELERADSTSPGLGQTDAIAEDLAERPSVQRVQAWLARLLDALCAHHPPQPAACRVCGCTDADCSGCVQRTGGPCYWVDDEHTLCSSCLPVMPEVDGCDDGDPCTVHDCANAEWWCDRCQDFVAPALVAAPAPDLPARHTVCGGDLRLRCVCDDGDPCTSDDACNGFLVDEATRDRSGCRDGDAVRRGEAPSGVDDCPECHGTGRAACNDGNPRGGTRDAKEICDV